MEELQKSYSDFGFSLLREGLLSKDCSSPGNNIFFSPISIAMALTMTAYGSKKNTKQQLVQSLNLVNLSDMDILENQQKILITSSDGCKLNIANALFLDTEFSVKKEYVDCLCKYFKAECRNVDFQHNSIDSAKEINQFVEDQTNRMIRDLITTDAVGPSTAMVLINAIHFKGLWKEPFKPEYTKKAIFHVSGSKTTEVDMMYLETDLRSAHIPELECRCLMIPYSSGPVTLLLLLPDKIDGLNIIEKNITVEMLSKINHKLGDYERNVALSLPKFKITESMKLRDILMSMGIKDMFQEGVADLTGISEYSNLIVSDAIHQACIEVNEEGTEAAAATALIIQLCCMVYPEEFTFDHPFMMIIQNSATSSVYFIGSIREI